MTGALAPIAGAMPARWDAVTPERASTPHRWVMDVLAREGDGITRMLWRMLRREADVLDALQDTFCKLAQRGGDVDLRSARAYVYRTAANVGIELIRARRRRGRHREAIAAERSRRASPDGSVDADLVDSIAHDGLRDAIGQLPPHLRGVVVLRDLARMTYDEVGRILGIEPATARVYRRHAVVRLSELLGGATGPC